MRRIALTVALITASVAQAQMTVNFEWAREHRCSKSSPSLSISGIPAGATALTVKLIDNDMSSWNHGGGKVTITNVPEFAIETGALKDGYNGPCPPNFSSFGHDYQFVVRALDASGNELAQTAQTRTFSAAKVPK